MGAAWTDDGVAQAIGASVNAVQKHPTMTGSGAASTTPSDSTPEGPHAPDELWKAVCAREGHPTEGPDARRARSTFDAALSEATKRGQRLTRTDTGVRLRSKETIEAASRARQRWQAHLDGTEGPDEVLTEVLRCWLLEAPLESWPETWTLIEGERVLTWDGFDLSKALVAWARRISGLRFREDAPHVAHLLHAAGAMDALA